jgi:hypothetical protein
MVKGRPEIKFTGRIVEIRPAQKSLPDPALSIQAGGTIAVAQGEGGQPQADLAAEQLYELLIEVDEQMDERLRVGQRVMVRLSMPEKPLAQQWYRSLLQLVATRFSKA